LLLYCCYCYYYCYYYYYYYLLLLFSSCFEFNFSLPSHLQQAVDAGRCLFGTVDSFLVWHLTGGTQGGTMAMMACLFSCVA
jgi:hypothetical protein